MVEPELVAIGAEAPARLTDLGVMPEPGGEGEPDAGAHARECAGAASRLAEQDDPISVQLLDEEGVDLAAVLEPRPIPGVRDVYGWVRVQLTCRLVDQGPGAAPVAFSGHRPPETGTDDPTTPRVSASAKEALSS